MKSGFPSPNFVDMIVLGVLFIGLLRGRKRGLSEELLDVLQWLAIVGVGGLVYKPLGNFVASFTHLSPMLAYLATYLFLGIVVTLIFTGIKKAVGEKLVGGDVFGRGEYYLGMVAGVIRFACMIVVAMALLHAKHITPAERAATAKMQKDNFGSISAPTLGSLQQSVFFDSICGRFAAQYLKGQLIVSTPAAGGPIKPREGLGRKSEKAVDEVIDEKPRK